ncbi:alpha/beta hydrolase domain-containing protein [Actinospongicola halichondriae]|uniref:alpha/beta hydrolase domain-containing protein n=1 Tax=Actinospongicola halichondriae TaxID=3236844 RepID=UPI003D4763D4
MITRRLLLVGVPFALVIGACSSSDDVDRSTPVTTIALDTTTTTTIESADLEVVGPIAGAPQTSGANGLDAAGYVEEEFFVSGDAAAFEPDGDLTDDGRWILSEDDTAPFTTRILVKRPADRADASGVVVVEWNNVSAGSDGTPDWSYTSAEMLRAGHVHIGVSAQKAGVDGDAGGDIGGFGAPLTTSDPERYADLAHPGDPYSYDLFRLVGRLARGGASVGPDPLEGFPREHVIAVGESQSAFRLTSYVNGVQPLDPVFDGFLVHSRGGGAAPFDDADGLTSGVVGQVRLRDDLDAPILVFTTETDLTVLGYARARQPDSDAVVDWEVAGTAHADAFLIGGDPQAAADALGCPQPVNDGPQNIALKAAVAALVDWVVDGTAPPTGDRIEVDDDGAIVRDADGLAVGGIRLPAVTVPSGSLSGDPADGATLICSLFGTTTPFGPDEMAARYGSSAGYAAAVDAAYDEAVAAGFALEGDRQSVLDEASTVPFP